eukprot:snap_masked-scaffold_14-processed-gene-7.40-mRNA-1 protein AED:0.33 eAED:0.33 QI:0/-1/0/1/-1/1/1/0/230
MDLKEEFERFEDYLDAQISANDMYYLEDLGMARELVKLGYRGVAGEEILSYEEFKRQKRAQNSTDVLSVNEGKLASELVDAECYKESNFLKELALREEQCFSGFLSTIIFLRLKIKDSEVSAYVDLNARFEDPSEDFIAYFKGWKTFLPRNSDLSYMDWSNYDIKSNSSANYQVIADAEAGLLFKNKKDRKIINVDPSARHQGDNTVRKECTSKEYLQVVFFDHFARKRC